MPLLLLPVFLVAWGAWSTWNDDDGASSGTKLMVLVVAFVGVWGAVAYFLVRAGVFVQLGNAIATVAKALGLTDILGSLGGLVARFV